MRRLFRMSLLTVMLCMLGFTAGQAADKPEVLVGGRVAPGTVRVFSKDSVYKVYQNLVIGGTLIVEPGTTVKFSPNGRIIDSTGGRLIADGYAKAAYTAQPDGINPMPNKNNKGWTGYADLNYFLYGNTVVAGTMAEPTVNKSKNDYVFNVILNTSTRALRDGYNSLNGKGYTLGSNEVVIPFEKAIIYELSGLAGVTDNVNDIRNNYPWKRANSSDPIQLTEGKINFVGQVTNNFTREKGHIIVLPGARAAFFRNCAFENMRKDTTVDYQDYYAAGSMPKVAEINKKMIALSNGRGGAITTFSSRTWLVDCEFNHNFARNAAGALQVLQTPDGFPESADKYAALGYYPATKNPALTNPDGTTSIYNNKIARIDNLDEAFETEGLTDYERQAYDDARVSIFLGRMRNLKFNYNTAKLTNVKIQYFGSIPVEVDDESSVANYPQFDSRNFTKGGAVLIAGNKTIEGDQIEVALGLNQRIKIRNAANTADTTLILTPYDTLEFNGNYVQNYQNSISSEGSMGGAIYLGANTSLIVAGKFNSNYAKTQNLGEETMEARAGYYARGGAIYQENTYARLQVRGFSDNMVGQVPTRFTNNESAAGGAIYVDGNDDALMSPIIGGTDKNVTTRDYGYNIKFQNNVATTEGGAIYTKRNMRINGSGGVSDNALIGYTNDFRVCFENNEARLSGGAITIALPFVNPPLPAAKRNIYMARTLFTNNAVGYNVSAYNKEKVRGGGAVYSENADMNVVKGVEFNANAVKNGNGGAIQMVHPVSFNKRFFVSDLDSIVNDKDGVPSRVISNDAAFINDRETAKYPADARMLTRFLDNKVEWDDDVLASQSGSGFTQINAGTVTTAARINAVEFINNNTGFAVGAQGTIIKMTNAGTIWEYKNLSTPYNLSAIHFVTDRIGFIAGDQGLIMKTTDGGNTWNIVKQPTENFNINALTFINSEVGYAAGQNGKMLRTADAGATWTTLATGTANHLLDINFAGLNNGYVVGKRGTILHSTDQGASWNVLNANTFTDLNSIYFTDANTGYIAGNGAIYKTTNGGATWASVYTNSSKNFTTVFFTGLNTGYAYGSYGAAAYTTDGGATWTDGAVKVNGEQVFYSFNDVFYPTANVAVLGATNGVMLRTADNGATWNYVLPYDAAVVDVHRYHPSMTNLRENGIGLGGAIYILDSVTTRDGSKEDFIRFNRVRMENNTSYTGAGIYSDNYGLKMIFTRSLVYGNTASSTIGRKQNAITGPALDKDKDGVIDGNYASSDLASAVLYGEIVGPEPYESYSWAANSMYGNDAKFLIRVPDAPNTKGALAGQRPGPGGVDTLQGNYWGKTEADVTLFLNNLKDVEYNGRDYDRTETFFIDKCDKTYLNYVYGSSDTLNQGPFEYNGTYTTIGSSDETITRFNYVPVALRNAESENVADTNTIPEKYLFSSRVYDLYDKGTDIKVVDYSNRRMSPIEDFAVGIPPTLRSHTDATHPNGTTYLRRWVRDPQVVEATDANGKLLYPMIAALQTEWKPDVKNLNNETKGFYQPIGYPLFLEMQADYDGDIEMSNHDVRMPNQSVVFVINETTGDFIRSNMTQVTEDGINWEKYRSRVDLVPDMTKRNQATTVRRTAEKLLNLGVGDVLLYALKDNPENEDNAAMRGRKYYGPHTQMGGKLLNSSTNQGIQDLYLNKDEWPASNMETATYFGGEKYQALPVDTGDVVRIISRTELWKNGVIKAYNEGIAFKITESTMPPVFTGDIVKLQTDTIVKNLPDDRDPNKYTDVKITDFLNKRFVTEDRNYPQSAGTYSNMGDASGNDSILTVTAIDYNNFYDPRANDAAFNNCYPALSYSLSTVNGTGVSKWLRYKIVPAGPQGNKNVKDNAEGYMVLRGTPMNPYVVPGGEKVHAKVTNFPPSKRVIDLLRDQYGQDTLDKFIYLFPSYFSNPVYDLGENQRRARFLQQDTINYAKNYTADYEFDMFVVDSTPRFIAYNQSPVVYYKDVNYIPCTNEKYQDTNSVRVLYLPSVYRNGFCSLTSDDKLIASLTDKLRFQADFNTDDEAEDSWAGKDGWDYRYGKTSYGFYNIAMRDNPSDTSIIDLSNQTRPSWMANNYIYTYNSDTQADPYLSNFTSEGKLNVRVDGDAARKLLRVKNNFNNGMNLDTTISVVVNDGHSGMTMMPVDIYINVAPKIQDLTLPTAKENEDYNPTLLDTTRQIKIYDPNRDQKHRFELVYSGDPRNRIPKDPCFSEAGYWDLTSLKTTPNWLKINPESGMLYGTPKVTDNINPSEDEQVTVIVWDRIAQTANARANVKAIKDNGTNVIAVGEKGTIINVDRNGGSWQFVNVAGTEAFDLNAITFVSNDPQVGYIVGNNGLILKTTDGGATWTINNSTYRTYNLNAVSFADAQNGVAVGTEGNVLITNDGGATWTSLKQTNTAYTNTRSLNTVVMYDANTFFAAGDQNTAFRSTDRGTTMTPITVGAANKFVATYRVDNTKTMMISSNKAYASSDNGATWSQVTTPNAGVNSFTGIGYYEIGDATKYNNTKDQIVYITGKNATLYYSQDGGNNFTLSNAPGLNYRVTFDKAADGLTQNLNGITMTDENNGFVVADNGIIGKITKAVTMISKVDNSGQKVGDTTVAFTPIVITTKEYDMLSDVKTFALRVDTASYSPILTSAVRTGCVEKGITDFRDTLYVMDNDLFRPQSGEEVTLKVISPADANWKLSKTVVKVSDLGDLTKIPFILYYDGALNADPDEFGKVTVKIQATDKAGNTAIIEVVYRYSLAPDFLSKITVANNNGSYQVLEWGTAEKSDQKEKQVTTGDGNDGYNIGYLDENYCEYEIPPAPDKKIFDARWTIPTRTGTLRNIQPRATAGQACELVYKSTFQTGGNVDATGTSNFVPLTITWDKSIIPGRDNSTINPAGSTWFMRDANSNGNIFNINMATGEGNVMGDCKLTTAGDMVTLQLNSVVTVGFNIIFDCTSGVLNGNELVAGIKNVSPNPVSSNSSVAFAVSQYSNVKIELYDNLGNIVNTLVNAPYGAGEYTVDFKGTDNLGNYLANGTYTVRMTAGNATSSYQIKIVR